jgi:hypothetical protein
MSRLNSNLKFHRGRTHKIHLKKNHKGGDEGGGNDRACNSRPSRGSGELSAMNKEQFETIRGWMYLHETLTQRQVLFKGVAMLNEKEDDINLTGGTRRRTGSPVINQ